MNEYVINIFGSITTWGYSKSYMKYFLDQAKDKPVRVKVTSYGGDVNEGIAISQLFADHGNVTVEFIGFNASAATWMAYGAKNVEIHEDTLFLVHKCSMNVEIYGSLTADQLEQKIHELENAKKAAEAINLIIARKYLNRCQSKDKSLKDVLNLMNEERWMDADEIMEWGFADKKLEPSGKPVELSNEFRNELQARGLPVPKIADSKTENNDAKGLLNTILTWLDSMRNELNKKQGREENKNYNTELLYKNKIIMNESFEFLNVLLGIKGFEVKDEQVTLTIAQLSSLNQALKKAEDQKKDAEQNLRNASDALDALSDDIKSANSISDKVAKIKEILDRVPANDTHNKDKGDTDFSDIAKDPINNYGLED